MPIRLHACAARPIEPVCARRARTSALAHTHAAPKVSIDQRGSIDRPDRNVIFRSKRLRTYVPERAARIDRPSL
jgi:hypothetical protein